MFYYGFEVTEDYTILDFSEASTPLVERYAEIQAGYYSPTEFYAAIATAMSEAGTQAYSVDWNRTTRTTNFSAAANFTLKIASGSHSISTLWDLIGFNSAGADQSGTSIVTPNASGKIYEPQFYLLDYVPTENRQESIESSVNETGSGKVEIVKYGVRRFMECKISFINNYQNSVNGYLLYNPNGVADANDFMSDLIKKGHIEFIPDKTDVYTFETLMLENTEENRQGIGYKLKEDLQFGADYYTTGKLVFRKIES
jgi:hypothetical protein